MLRSLFGDISVLFIPFSNLQRICCTRNKLDAKITALIMQMTVPCS
uniref:Uncharacterized protein n=1 Tax=Anguilla anguilla TaxID=7936 RepID=A0A0E9S2I8_ANGAN